MQPSSPDAVRGRITARFRDAVCRPQAAACPHGLMHRRRTCCPPAPTDGERGSAVVEFTFLALLLIVPLVYFIITMSQIQGASFAVVGAADQAAKVYVAHADAGSAQAAAERVVLVALADYGHPAADARITTSCEPAGCQAAGTAVTVTIRLSVPLPFVPFSEDFRLDASLVEASATQLVGRFR
ncbi:MAG: hypothetical protein JWQ75_149 [Pseudarthrobacter sp.]|nr:hypothetical protein [Pseudarthrobacter sp.]